MHHLNFSPKAQKCIELALIETIFLFSNYYWLCDELLLSFIQYIIYDDFKSHINFKMIKI
jgi:hypothetical protein